ncbi:MAG: DUF4446 family protein [Lachnospiraceae bacterium]|nr:DUF4446 family protein [Lachnospiraceae bacterium]MEE1516650.1 DUF4446 family protein [Lachnospiraceae bacterium]
MESQMLDKINIDPFYIFVGLGVLILISIIINIAQQIKLNKIKKRYEAFMTGKEGKDLEHLLVDRLNQMDQLNEKQISQNQMMEEINDMLKDTYSKLAIVKYDAFKEMGGKLSFAFALLNEKNDGLIFNSMHNREGCYTYIKEIVNGESYILLSDEEKEVLEQAKNVRNYMLT